MPQSCVTDNPLGHGSRHPEPFPSKGHINGALLDARKVSGEGEDLEAAIEEQWMHLDAVAIHEVLKCEFSQGLTLPGPDGLEGVI